MYLRECWYVAAWSKELGDGPVARTILEQDVVLFRKSDGSVAALADRCPHRHVPLSMGTCTSAGLRCGYHGLVFDETGRCIKAPGQNFVPPIARVKTYPVADRYGWIWIWMGEATTDPSLIPDFGLLTSADHAAVGQTNHVRASYQLVIDNLMDLSHVGYVHTSTIGNAEFGALGKLTVRRTSDGVSAIRLVPNVPQPPLYLKSGVLPAGENIDRWSDIRFIGPSFVTIHTGGAPVGFGALEGRYETGLNLWIMNAMTPETKTTTNYFWAAVRAHALSDERVDQLFLSAVAEAFAEDCAVLEAEQRVIDKYGDSWSVALKGDAAAIEARRALQRMIEKEQATAPNVDAELNILDALLK